MRAATYTQGGAFAVHDIPRPEIGDDALLLRVTGASICGSDVKIVHFGHRKLQPGQRIVLGHEFLGVVERTGSRVSRFHVGQRVGVAPNAGCGVCDACLRGQANYCPNYLAFGINRDGAHAPFVEVPSRFITQGNVIPLPDTVSDREAALFEPFSCVVNGVRAARIQLGDTVVIYGAGPMGLLHVLLCRLAGAGQVVMVDPVESRLEQARSLGCDLTICPRTEDVVERLRRETDGHGADVVITACPSADVQPQAVQLLAPFGRLCLFGGLAKGVTPLALDTNLIHYNNLVVTGSTGGSVEDYRIALRLVAGKRVDLTRVIAHTFPLSDLENAYKTALAGPPGKVVLVAES